jgi:hypothetical protein
MSKAMTDTNIDTIAAPELPDDIRQGRDECVRLGWNRMLVGDRFEITEKGRRAFFWMHRHGENTLAPQTQINILCPDRPSN